MGATHQWSDFSPSSEGSKIGLDVVSQTCLTCKAEILVIRSAEGKGGITSVFVPPEPHVTQ